MACCPLHSITNGYGPWNDEHENNSILLSALKKNLTAFKGARLHLKGLVDHLGARAGMLPSGRFMTTGACSIYGAGYARTLPAGCLPQPGRGEALSAQVSDGRFGDDGMGCWCSLGQGRWCLCARRP